MCVMGWVGECEKKIREKGGVCERREMQKKRGVVACGVSRCVCMERRKGKCV